MKTASPVDKHLITRSYFDWGSKPAMVLCKCGMTFRDPNLKAAYRLWAEHKKQQDEGNER